jgi:hypothetical protein
MPRRRTQFRYVDATNMTRSKWFALISCAAVSSCLHHPPLADVKPGTVRITFGAPSDSQNRLLVKVRDGSAPARPLGFASITVIRLGADSIAKSAARWDAQSNSDGLATFILADSGLYEINVRLVRRASLRPRLRLGTRCLHSLDVYLEEASVPLAVPSQPETAPQSRGILTTCAAPI